MRVLAVDLGASSSRLLAVSLDDRLTLHEAHRFPTPAIAEKGYAGWDIGSLVSELVDAFSRLNRRQPVCSIGIDSWGVDFGLLDEEGELIANPIRYRDPSHLAGAEELKLRLDPVRHYELTGIQPLPFNTAAQLLARRMRNDPDLERAHTFAMIPDLVGRAWCGRGIPACERTQASTTQLLGLDGAWCMEACAAANVPQALLPVPADAGTQAGAEPSTNVPIIRVGSHDTASAVLACPGEGGDWAYISSGTWSLAGVELETPVTAKGALDAGFTNERGVGATIRFLKNLMGLWLLQRTQGDRSVGECVRLAREAPPFGARFDANHPDLLNPPDMAEAIRRLADGPVQTYAQLYRAIFENLAAAYARAIRDLERLTSRKIERIHVMGGGSRNDLLNRMTADATGLPVLAGPSEATALGNALVQFAYHGALKDPRTDGRALVHASFPPKEFRPNQVDDWAQWLYGNG
ncbi:MAG: rhamnulokinase [Armatimonadetes bacterium]|nr:rhamnulokinase [Armatimonadota bacterium]